MHALHTGLGGVAYVALETALLLQCRSSRAGKGQEPSTTTTTGSTQDQQDMQHYLDVAERYLRAAEAGFERGLRRGHRNDITFIMGSPGIYVRLSFCPPLEAIRPTLLESQHL